MCLPYEGMDCGRIVIYGFDPCNGHYVEYYYEWNGSTYIAVGCSPQPYCSECPMYPCLCFTDGGGFIVNYYCEPCPGGGPVGDGSGGGSGDDGSGGGGCDLCATLSQSNNYLNQILDQIANLNVNVGVDLSEVIRRLDRIISNQGVMITTMQGMANDLAAVRAKLEAIDTRLMTLTDIVNTKLNNIEGKLGSIEGKLGNIEGKLGSIEGKLDDIRSKLNRLDDIHSVLQDMRQLIELLGEKLDAVKDILSQVWDYLRDDQALTVMQQLTAAQLAYLDARMQYFYNALFLSVASYGELADLLYSNFASQYQRLNFGSDLIRVVGVGFVPAYNVVAEFNSVALYEAGLLQGAVAGWLTAVNTHYLPLASFPNFTIYLNLDHPEVFWVRQILRLMIAVFFTFSFIRRRYEEVTSLFAEVGDNA
jgi:predicted  nucleic acid-binding Zn-ribbon protein